MRQHPHPAKVICHKAGYHPAYVRRVLAGSRSNPTIQFIESMAGALEIHPLELLS